MDLLLGIDLGTSYFKVGLFDASGNLKGLGRVAVPKDEPAAGWSEIPVDRFWSLLREGVVLAKREAGADHRIVGVSYSSQANTFVLLDGEDRPLTPLVVWTDTRGMPMDADLAEFSRTDTFARTTGIAGLTGQWAVGKWRWFMRRQPDVWAKVRKIQTISDYFTYALTGERAGDGGTAAFLGMFDIRAGRWWADALAKVGVDPAMLSTPLPPGTPCGQTTSAAKGLIGVDAGASFAVGGLDHQIAALGSGLGRFADASISTGTVLAAMVLVDDPVPLPGCYHGPYLRRDQRTEAGDQKRAERFEGRGTSDAGQKTSPDSAAPSPFAPLPSTLSSPFFRLAFDGNGAGELEDYQKKHCPENSIEQLIAAAVASDASATGIPAEHAKGIRRILDRVAHSQATLLARVAPKGGVRRIVATGGGSRSAAWLQIKANVLGVPIVTPASPERACLGAALIASVPAGLHASLATASASMVHESRTFNPGKEPRMETNERGSD